MNKISNAVLGHFTKIHCISSLYWGFSAFFGVVQNRHFALFLSYYYDLIFTNKIEPAIRRAENR